MWSSRSSAIPRSGQIRRAALMAGATVLMVLLAPVGADAHAVLVSSDPVPGADLRTTPAVVTLVFDEPLATGLSRATVVGPTGRSSASTVEGETMRVRVGSRATGVYRVTWRTVSRIDGHTIEGSFRFGVAARVTGAAVDPPAPARRDVVLSALRSAEYALLLLACGMVLLQWLGRSLDLRQPYLPVALALLGSGLVVVGAEIAVAGSSLSLRATGDYFSTGLAGWARAARVLLEAFLVVVAWWRHRFSAPALAGIVVMVGVAGHGADVEPAWQGMAVNAAHLAAAAVWAGGLLALALVRFRGCWPVVGRDLLRGFSRVAPWAFAASVGLGAVQAYELLGSPHSLATTTYGRILVVKAAVVVGMVPLSWLAWRRKREHLRGEAAMALVVTAAAAALAAFPVVPREAGEAAAAVSQASPVSPVSPVSPASVAWSPRPGDLTLGGRAGDVMVGLTLHPGRPGPNRVTVYLAAPAAGGADARVRVGGRPSDLVRCGPRCRTGSVVLRGAERLVVRVPGHGTASYPLPALPAPDGTGLLRAATQRMAALGSYRVRENLSGFRSSYVYERPHRMFVRTWFGNGPHDTLWLGHRLYLRSSPADDWQRQSGAGLAPVPYFPWYPFRPLTGARIIGDARLGAGRATAITTFGGHGHRPEPVWFTLYVDRSTGAVLRSEMWAPNHFMLDRYRPIGSPVRLPSPPGRLR